VGSGKATVHCADHVRLYVKSTEMCNFTSIAIDVELHTKAAQAARCPGKPPRADVSSLRRLTVAARTPAAGAAGGAIARRARHLAARGGGEESYRRAAGGSDAAARATHHREPGLQVRGSRQREAGRRLRTYLRHEAEIDDDAKSIARERGRRTLVLTDDLFQVDTLPAVLSKD
jgi:hypothetical protein